MAFKTFCDRCSDEIEAECDNRADGNSVLKVNDTGVKIGIKLDSKHQHLCTKCAVQILRAAVLKYGDGA